MRARPIKTSPLFLLLPLALMTPWLAHLDESTSEPEVAQVARGIDGRLQRIKAIPTREHGIDRPSTMVWSERLGALVLTDADRPHKRRAVRPNESDVRRPPGRLPVPQGPPEVGGALAGHDLRGAARHPQTGHLFTYDSSSDRVHELSGSTLVASYDATDLEVDNARGIVLAPSADPTDHPTELSVYVADGGGADTLGQVVEATFASDFALVAAETPTSIREVETSAYSPPSPDPSGLAFLPGEDRLFIADGEVDEMSIFRDRNLFVTTRAGALTDTGVSQPWSDEPVGVGYNATNNHLFISDDDQKAVFELRAGSDGRFGTPDDSYTSFETDRDGATDPEGVEYDAATNSLWFAGGEAADFHRLQAGGDGDFGTSDDVWTNFDAGLYGMQDPEGIGFDDVRGTLVIIDDSSETIYELDRSGALLNTIDVSAANMRAAAGLTIAPASNGSGDRTYYVVARGVDNDSHPDENDGRLYEITASLPPLSGGGGGPVNQAPSVDAGPDLGVELPASAALNGTVSDDGLPDDPGEVTTLWAQVSGPGTTSFANPNEVDTTASFSTAGTYVLRLAATDGQAASADEVTVSVSPAGGATVVESRIATGADDVEESVNSGSVLMGSSDLELTTDGNTQQVVGMRFRGLQLPKNAEILNAYVQFWVDEVSTGGSALTIRAEASDNAPAYVSANRNVSNRATTSASVSWSPPGWTQTGEAGPDQRTPDLSQPLQAVVNRSGWSPGNALALQVSGTGRRAAEAFESGAGTSALLHVEYTGGGGGGPANQAPTVDAGANATVQLPDTATLTGTVTDDGLPTGSTVTTTWTRVSGPGTVTFDDPAAEDTTASFSAAGTYVLRLTATDGDLTASDDTTIEVQPAAPGNQAPTVDAGANATVQLPDTATLTGTVTDDGLPTGSTVTTTWTRVSGPGTVTFDDPAAEDTTASFSAAGTYVLRLTATDGDLTASDDTTIEVQPAAPGNQAPTVDAGANATVQLPDTATLTGTVTDDGLPTGSTVTTTWTRVSGPGTVTFDDPAAEDTTASFSAAGTYVLRLTATDGDLTATDDTTIEVQPAAGGGGGGNQAEVRVSAGSDDAEQQPSGSTSLNSSDLELTTDKSRQQVVGIRFAGVPVPAGATITSAYVQFTTDESSAGASSLTIRAEASDSAETYRSATNNVTGRTTGSAAVSWSPPDWPTVGQAGHAQRTPDLSPLVQQVVSRPGWVAGSALALQVTGTGRRAAESYNGSRAAAPLLHVEYTGGDSTPVNQAPVVDAGPNRTVTLPETAALDGTVTDDGLPNPPGAVSTTWSKASGPGDVTFDDAAAVSTTASFSAPGTYVLRLAATDGVRTGDDRLTIVVQEPGGGGGPQTVQVRVSAGSDDVEESVRSGKTLTSSSDLELTTDGHTEQVVGIRFRNVVVPAGATVTSAYLQFTTDEVSTGPSALTLRAEAKANAAAFTGAVNAVTSRPTTTEGVSWSPGDWTLVNQAGPEQRTPDLAALVQAVVDLNGWGPGNAMAFQVSGTGVRKARSFESGASIAPLLHIEYTTG